MTAMTATPPLFLQPLADRHGAPAGLLFAAGADQFEILPQADLQALGAQFRCFYRAETAAPLAQILHDCGWRELPSAAVQHCEVFDPQLPPDIHWLDGDWYLAAPAKPVGNQAASRALALQLVQLVNADADTHEIEALLRHDPTLSYHLLRLVNSLGMGTGRRVTSFSQAILIIGRQQLRRWLNLMLFAAREGDVRAAMLLARVAVRARSMELLAKAAGLDKHTQEQGFMVGMFSLLGVLFGLPLAEVLQPLTVSEAVQAALLTHSGELGSLLALLELGERGAFEPLAEQLEAAQIDADEFNRIVADANLWMLSVATGGTGSAHA